MCIVFKSVFFQSIPAPAPLSYFASFKFNPRRQLSRSTVGGSAYLRLSAAGTVQSLAVALCSDNERVALYSLDQQLRGLHWLVKS